MIDILMKFKLSSIATLLTSHMSAFTPFYAMPHIKVWNCFLFKTAFVVYDKRFFINLLTITCNYYNMKT